MEASGGKGYSSITRIAEYSFDIVHASVSFLESFFFRHRWLSDLQSVLCIQRGRDEDTHFAMALLLLI